MMSAVQPFISGAISKTVNVPENITVEQITDLFMQAWRLGVKAIAIYRDNSKKTQPLNVGQGTKARETKTQTAKEFKPVRRKLPSVRECHDAQIQHREGTRATSPSGCTTTDSPVKFSS